MKYGYRMPQYKQCMWTFVFNKDEDHARIVATIQRKRQLLAARVGCIYKSRLKICPL